MSESNPAPARRQWIRVAAYGVIVRDGAMLLCRLSSLEPEVGKWTLPGGGLDFGEKPDAGMRREVFEETGLRVTSHELLAVDTNVYAFEDSEMYAVQLYYRAEVGDGAIQVEIDGTTDGCEWIPLERLPTLPHVSIVDFALRLIRDR